MPGALTHDPLRPGGDLYKAKGSDGASPVFVNSDGTLVDSLGAPVSGGWISSLASNWASVGDSLSANSFNITAPTVYETRGRGFVSWAQALSGRRIAMVDVQCQGGAWVGSGGVVAPSLSAQLDAVIANRRASQVLILGGVNDVLGDRTGAAIFADLEAIVARALNAGLSVWLCTAPPMGSSHGSYTVARQAELLALNERIRQLRYLETTNRFYVVDLFAAVVDPAASAPTLIGTYDNLHTNNLAAYRIGKALAARINAVVPVVDSLISSNADNQGYSATSANILDNGLFVNGTGTATGFTASVSGASHTPSLVAHAGGFGNYQRLVATSSATNQHSRLSSGDLKARVSNGDILVAECEVVVTSPTNLRCVRLNLTVTGASETRSASDFQLDATNDVALPESFTATLRTAPITVDTAAQGALSAVAAQVTQFFAGAGGATLDIGRMSVRKVLA